ncbi:DUF2333 family protein [candidate division KSB1 bacterium]|nr:DUF2333 family protein [candidate division KSB1 bacterium]
MSVFKKIWNAIKAFFIYLFTFKPFEWHKIPLIIILIYLILTPFVMLFNNTFPDFVEVKPTKSKPGVMFSSVLIEMGDDMLKAWLPNDLLYPTIFLDNKPNFQMGELEIIRYSIRMLRDKLSRLRTTDTIDENCDKAFVYISNEPERWMLPSAESRYKKAFSELRKYQANLEKGEASFYPRADNLIELLDQINSLLGGVNTRLSHAPRDEKFLISEETAGDQFIEGEKKVFVKVPWHKIDDNFYYARGVAYGVRNIMMAVKYEFAEVIELKKSTELVDRIIDLLDYCQFEPIYIANGKRGSLWANHSLELLATTNDIRQKISSLQSMLAN